MKIRAALLAYLLLGNAAFGQVQQGGTVTPGHAVQWTSNGIIQDAGTAASGSLTSLGVTNNGGPGVCVNSAPITTDYNSICMAVDNTNGGIISVDNHGGATGGLSFMINGVLIPIGGTAITIGATTVIGGTSGNFLYDNAGIVGGFNLFGAPNTWAGMQALNGGATVPTVSFGDNTNSVASTAFVQAAISGGIIPANSMMSNWTNALGVSIPNTIPSCPDTGGNHLNYVTGSGMICGTSGGGGGGTDAGSLTGTTMAANVINSSLTKVGTLTTGTTGAGFIVALATSTITGTLPTANLPLVDLTTKVTGILPIANGGTGASTASAALTNLGALPLAGGTMGGNLLLNADPTVSMQAATKHYVDLNASGVQPKASVVAATTTNGTLASAYENGDVIDSVTLATGNRILIKNQSAPAENGIYTVNASGAPTRAVDATPWSEIVGAQTLVTGGGQASTGWTAQVTAGGTIDVTAMPWVQTSANTAYSAGTGLTLTGTVFSIGAGQVTNTMLAAPVSTAKGGSGIDMSATSGVILITAGAGSMIGGGTGSGGVVRDTNSSAANLTVTGTLTTNQELHLIGTTPNIQMDPTSGATKTAQLYQSADVFGVGAAGIATYLSVNLNNGSTTLGGGYTYLGGFNGGSSFPRSGTDLAVIWNSTDGGRDIGFYNTDVLATESYQFNQLTGTSSKRTIMALLSNGSVGIGTRAPAGHFEVQDTGSAYNSGVGSIVISNTSDPNKRLGLGYDVGLGAQGSGWIQAVRPGIIFTPLLLNPNAGNVGINTTNPATALDVNGTASVTSTLAVGSQVAIGGGGFSRSLAINSGGASISLLDGAEQWAIGQETGGAHRLSFYSPAFGYALILDHSNGAATFSSSISAGTSIGAGTSITAGTTITANSSITSGGANVSAGTFLSGQEVILGQATPYVDFQASSATKGARIVQSTNRLYFQWAGVANWMILDIDKGALGFGIDPIGGTAGVGINPGIAIGNSGVPIIQTNPYVDSHNTMAGLVVKMHDQPAGAGYLANGLDFALIGTILSTNNTGVFANKVGTMGSAQGSGATSGNIWGMYAECQLDAGSNPAGICIGIEVDVNNEENTRSTNWGAPAYGVQITGASNYTATAALFISTGLGPAINFNTGILFVGSGMQTGIEFSPDVSPNNAFSLGVMRIPNNQAIVFRDNSNTVNVNALYLDTGNVFQVGGGEPVGMNLFPSAAPWVACWDGNRMDYQDWNTGCAASSERFKQNIASFSNDRAFDIVTKLQPITFQYKSEQKMGDETHMGFTAEQAEKVDPALITYDKDGKPYAFKYQEMAPILVGAIQKLNDDNAALRARVDALENLAKAKPP